MIANPADNHIAARKLGIFSDGTTAHPEYVNVTVQATLGLRGVLPPFPVLTCYAPINGEVGAAARAKRYAWNELGTAYNLFQTANAAQIAASRDPHLSDAGRTNAIREAAKPWTTRYNYFDGFIADLNLTCAALNTEFEADCQPQPIESLDAVSAAMDAELRSMVRGMLQYDRMTYLRRQGAGSRIAEAIIRPGIPELSGIDADEMRRLKMIYALSKGKDTIKTMWEAACVLDTVALVIQYGSSVLSAATGEDNHSNMVREKLYRATEYHALAKNIEDIIQTLDEYQEPSKPNFSYLPDDLKPDPNTEKTIVEGAGA